MSTFFFTPAVHHGRSVRFHTGERQYRAGRIFPVFLPFLGCPGQCVYCAQDKQTGHEVPSGTKEILAEARILLEKASPCTAREERELAFYGGTFTALPESERALCLEFLQNMRSCRRVTRARCSTRPDALSPAVLKELLIAGVDLVELGIQSFDDEALALSRRGYSGSGAEAGCRAVAGAGLSLGIQLLPGMPGSTPEVFLADVEKALSLSPACLRFYPCLVPEGTVLARWYREGSYRPWSVEDTVRTLGTALHMAWKARVPVIRLAVAPEPAFDRALIAGPRHPALGALIQAESLLSAAKEARDALGREPERLVLPRFCQGFLYGDRGALKKRWSMLGLGPERIVFDAHAHEAELF